jgi:hypothetical protein
VKHTAGFGGSVVISGTAARKPAGLEARGAPPWPAPAAVGAGVREAGLSLAAAARVVTRYVVHLDVLVNGHAVSVPAGIGVDFRGHGVAPLTTSDGSGIIHVASDAIAPRFTLGQFFDEWQVTLTAGRLGGLRGGTVAAYVNGSLSRGDPAAVVLAPHQEIAVSYVAGRGAVRMPASYSFPAGM